MKGIESVDNLHHRAQACISQHVTALTVFSDCAWKRTKVHYFCRKVSQTFFRKLVWTREDFFRGWITIRACPLPPRLDLHLSLRCTRRVNNDSTIDFLGHNYPITTTKRKSVTIVHHPHSHFWVVPHPPLPENPVWPTILASYSL